MARRLMGPSWVVERAAEELRALEAQHPGRFGLLKLELRALLSESGAGSCPHMPSTGSSWVAERAVEELPALEVEHPHGLDHLELELRAFISDSLRPFPSLHPSEASLPRCLPLPSVCSAATQGFPHGDHQILVVISICSRQTIPEEEFSKQGPIKEEEGHGGTQGRRWRRDGPEAAGSEDDGRQGQCEPGVERAEECLRKIRRVKEMLANGC